MLARHRREHILWIFLSHPKRRAVLPANTSENPSYEVMAIFCTILSKFSKTSVWSSPRVFGFPSLDSWESITNKKLSKITPNAKFMMFFTGIFFSKFEIASHAKISKHMYFKLFWNPGIACAFLICVVICFSTSVTSFLIEISYDSPLPVFE